MTATSSGSLTCLPAWGTRRNPTRATWGPYVARVAVKLGKPLMPWQRHVLDVALEIDPVTGYLWYRDVDVYVPRQSGKTTLNLPRVVWRAETAKHLGGRQFMLYAAQTGKDAKAKWQEDYLEDLAAAPVMRWGRPDALARPILATGRERLRFRNGSIFAPTATTEIGGHGRSLDEGTLDEFWAQVDNRVSDAWRPAMITRKWAQFWKQSTAGTHRSIPLRAAVRSGRAMIEAGQEADSRRAYFEWSLPATYDPVDPASWALCMPALGHTISVEAIRHELQTMLDDPALGLSAFRRAYLNQWQDEFDDTEWIFPRAAWAQCRDPESARSGPHALAVDATPDRAKASVAFAANRADGLPMAKVVRDGDGVGWLAAHVGQIVREKGATCVVVDGVSPAHTELDAIEREVGGRCPVWVTNAGEMADACGSMYDGVVTEQFRHCGQPELDAALAGAAWRPMSGGRRAYDRKTSTSNIAPLVSATLAVAGLGKYPGNGGILW